MTTHTIFWDSQIIFMKKNQTKVLYPTVSFLLLTTCLIVPQYCVLSWFITTRHGFVCGPWRTRLYINYLGKAYGKNALDLYFRNAARLVTSLRRWIGKTDWKQRRLRFLEGTAPSDAASHFQEGPIKKQIENRERYGTLFVLSQPWEEKHTSLPQPLAWWRKWNIF